MPDIDWMKTVEDRLKDLEDYKTGHQAEIMGYWKSQFEINQDIETRSRAMEKWMHRAVGILSVVSLLGGGVGAAVATLLLRG